MFDINIVYLCMTHHPLVHSLEVSTSCGTFQQLSPTLHLFFAIKELKGGDLASDLQGVVLVFTMMYFSQPEMSKYCDFPSLFNGFMMHYCAKPLEQVWKVTSFTRLWLWIEYNRLVLLLCHGKRHLQLLGWGGLMPREAARGAFQLDCFQNMDDPLPDPDTAFGPVIKDLSYDLI